MANRFTTQGGSGEADETEDSNQSTGSDAESDSTDTQATEERNTTSDPTRTRTRTTQSRDEGFTTPEGGSDPVQSPDSGDSSDGGTGGGTSSRDEGFTTPSPGGSDTVQPPDSGGGGEDTGEPPTDPTDPEGPDGGGDGPSPSPDPGGPEGPDGGGDGPSPSPDPTDPAGPTDSGTGGGGGGGSDPPSGTGGSSSTGESYQFDVAEDRPGRVGAQARNIEQEIVEDNPFVDETDVRIVEEERGGETYLVPEFTEAHREEAARRDARAYVINTTEAGSEDIENVSVDENLLTDDQYQVEVSDDYRRERTADELSGVSAEDVVLSEEDGETQVDYQETLQNTAARDPDTSAEELEAEHGVDVDQDESVAQRFRGPGEDSPEGIVLQGARHRAEGEIVDPGPELEAYVNALEESDAQDQVRESIEDQFPGFQEGEEYEVVETDEGGYRADLTDQGQQEAVRQQAEATVAERLGVDEGDVGATVSERDEPAVNQSSSMTGGIAGPGGVAARDFEGASRYDIEIDLSQDAQADIATDRAERQIATRYDLDEDDVFVDAEPRSEEELLRGRQRARADPNIDEVQTIDLDISRGTRERIMEAQVADANEDLSREDVQAYRDEETGEFGVRTVDEEEFGDYQLNVPGTDRTFEGLARGGAILIRRSADRVGDVTGDIAAAPYTAANTEVPGLDESAAERFGVAAETEQLEESTDTAVDTAVTYGVGEGMNPLNYVIATKEAVEYGAYSGEEIAEGREQELAGDTADAIQERGEATYDFARENPLAFWSLVGGSLLFTGGAIRAASSVGPRTGLAARYAIQPAEEIAVGGATRVARTSATGQRALSRLPGNRLGPEEVGTAAASRVSREARQRARSVSDLVRGERSLSPGPRQAEMIDRFRPGARGQTFEAENPAQVSRETDVGAGATSEPLGSPTQNIVDATTGTGRPQPTAEPAPDSGPTASGEIESETDSLPLRQNLQEAGGVRAYLRGEDVPQRIPRTAESPEISDLVRGERGQLQFGRERGRGRTEQEDPTGPSVQPGEIQSDIQDVTLEQRRLFSGEVESRVDPVGRSMDPSIPRRRVERSEVQQSAEVARGDIEAGELLDGAQRSSVWAELEPGAQFDTQDLLSQAQESTAEIDTGQQPTQDPQSTELTDTALDVGPATTELQDTFQSTGLQTDTRLDQDLESVAITDRPVDTAPEGQPEGRFDGDFSVDLTRRPPERPRRPPIRPPDDNNALEEIGDEVTFETDESLFESGIRDIDTEDIDSIF